MSKPLHLSTNPEILVKIGPLASEPAWLRGRPLKKNKKINKEKTSVKYIALPATLPSGLNKTSIIKKFGEIQSFGRVVSEICVRTDIGLLTATQRRSSPYSTPLLEARLKKLNMLPRFTSGGCTAVYKLILRCSAVYKDRSCENSLKKC